LRQQQIPTNLQKITKSAQNSLFTTRSVVERLALADPLPLAVEAEAPDAEVSAVAAAPFVDDEEAIQSDTCCE
jgi:hypothetical protein